MVSFSFSLMSGVICPALVFPAHGKLEHEHRSYRGTVQIVCDEGFMYSKPKYAKRECLADATWSGENGICESKSTEIISGKTVYPIPGYPFILEM